MTTEFLREVFQTKISDAQSILSAVLLEYTLLIVACRREEYRGKKQKPMYLLYDVRDKVMVLAAACYCPGPITKHGASIVRDRTVRYSGDQLHSWNKVDFTSCF